VWIGDSNWDLTEQWKKVYEFFKCVGTANECYPELIEKDGFKVFKYHGTSTDELTLIDFLYWQGFHITTVTEQFVSIKKIKESGFLSK